MKKLLKNPDVGPYESPSPSPASKEHIVIQQSKNYNSPYIFSLLLLTIPRKK